MADLSITAANVIKGSGAQLVVETGGEAGTAGALVYKSSSDSKLYLSDSNDTNKAAVYGILLCTMVANQPVQVLQSGPITIGGTLTAGKFYYLSTTAGAIADTAPSSGSRVIQIGYATTTALLNVSIVDTGVVL